MTVCRPPAKSPILLDIQFEHSNGGYLFSLSWEAVPQSYTSIRRTILPICGYFPWQLQACFGISKATRVADGVSCERIAHGLWRKPVNRLVDYQRRILVDELTNVFPAKTPDEWPTWGIKAAVRYNSSSSVLKLLELINLSCATTTPYRAAVMKMGLHNTRVQYFQSNR